MAYLINGKNILKINELSYDGDNRTKATFNSTNFLFDSNKLNTYPTNTQMVSWYPNYIYSENGMGTEFRLNGESLFASKRGFRPTSNNLKYSSPSSGTYYINKFSDGEVWVSNTSNSKTGQIISTSNEDINYVFVELVAGGGGGGGAGTLQSAGGGGGGGYAWVCVKLSPNNYVKIVVGGGGSRGTNAGGGGGGGQTILEVGDYSITCNGGSGGKYSGDGGGGGSVESSSNTSFGRTVHKINGGNGGSTSGNRRGGSIDVSFENHMPESVWIDKKKDSGTSQGSSGWGGSGGASALGNGSNSVYQGHSDATEPGGGACGGGNYVLSRRDGGQGARGTFNIFY